MNYWPAEICGMGDMHMPLMDLVDALRVTGRETARLHYGARGVVSHHNVDIWALSNPVGDCGRNTAGYAFWPMSFGWLCRHMVEHYDYTLDDAFLRERVLPALDDCVEFFLDILYENRRRPTRNNSGHVARKLVHIRRRAHICGPSPAR